MSSPLPPGLYPWTLYPACRTAQAEGGRVPRAGSCRAGPFRKGAGHHALAGMGSFRPSLRQEPPLSASRGEGLRIPLSLCPLLLGPQVGLTVEEKGLIFTVSLGYFSDRCSRNVFNFPNLFTHQFTLER